jgi:uncharacterized protein (TIGR02300 family)
MWLWGTPPGNFALTCEGWEQHLRNCGVPGVAKTELGTKRQCQSCGARFYDLQRDPITCPKCSTVFVVEQVTRTRRPRADATVAAKPKPKLVEVAEEAADPELVEAAGEEAEEEEFIEDASELGEDETDVADVVERDVEGEDDTTR